MLDIYAQVCAEWEKLLSLLNTLFPKQLKLEHDDDRVSYGKVVGRW